MIGLIQKIIQLLVIGGLVLVIAKPMMVPEPARGIAQKVHILVMGEADTWQSFQLTWKQRMEWAGSLIPWFKKLATTIPPEKPQITADGILNLFNNLIITKPISKFEAIKQELVASPSASSGANP